MIKNKKAETLGSTLTWMVAIFIIVFILIIFIAATLFISLKKEGIGITKEELKRKSDLFSTKTLVSLLNTDVSVNGNEKKIKNMIAEWADSRDKKMKNEIKNKIEEYLDSLLGKDEGYIFYAAYSEKDKEIKEGLYGGGSISISGAEDYISLSNNFYTMYGAATKAKYALERAPTLYLSSNKKIKIRLYIGKIK